MAYFRLSLLTKQHGNIEGYIKNTISEFYGNGQPEELFRYEQLNNQTPNYSNNAVKLDTIFTKTYTYNEKLQLHQQGQKELSFSLDKKILDDDTWKDNPFASKIKDGSLLMLEDKYNNRILFTVKNIAYKNTENNIIYTYTCQDSFSFQLSKQSDGYTINNDLNSEDFIGALSVDEWVNKINEECKIPYSYLKLATPLYLCSNGVAVTTLALAEKNEYKVIKVLKASYPKIKENLDLYETIPFSCSGSTANGALIALGEQLGLTLNTATVLEEVETSAAIKIKTYYWFEPSKNTKVTGLRYSPFRDIKDFSFAQKADSLITMLNIEGRTLNSEEVITAIPTLSPFFTILFNSSYWKKFSSYYPGMYKNLLLGPQFSIIKDRNQSVTITIDKTNETMVFRMVLDEEMYMLYSLYPLRSYQAGKIESEVVIVNESSELIVLTPRNVDFEATIVNESNSYYLDVILTGADIGTIETSTESSIIDYDIHVFFRNDYTDEDYEFATSADEMPWLENKLIDFSYFLTNNLISTKQQKEIDDVLENKLRKINAEILLNASLYYNQLHIQTKTIAEMTNNIDMAGAEASNIEKRFLKQGIQRNTDNSSFVERWNNIQYKLEGQRRSSFVNLYSTTSDYIRKFLNARQRCLKNLYNFRKAFEQPLDPMYSEYYTVEMRLLEDDSRENLYSFSATTHGKNYSKLSTSYVNNHPRFFIKDDNDNLVDYNNIQLYYDDSSHTPFEKDSHLVTKNNFSSMNLYTYADEWQKQDDFSTYDEDTKYYKQIYFIRQSDLLSAAGISSTTLLPNERFDLKLVYNTDYYTGLKMKGFVSNENGQYITLEKVFEDGQLITAVTLLSGSKIKGTTIVNDVSLTSYIISKEDLVGGKLEDAANNFTFETSTFYRLATEDDIVTSYLCKEGYNLNARIYKPYIERNFVTNGMIGGNFWNTRSLAYTPRSDAASHTYNPEYKPTQPYPSETQLTENQNPGWGQVTYWGTYLAFFALMPISLLLSNLPRQDYLTLGGWVKVPYHVAEEQSSSGGDFSYAPYRYKVEYFRANYVKNFPLDKLYKKYTENGVDYSKDDDYIEIVNKSNYTNFFVKNHADLYNTKHYTSAGEGIFTSVDDKNFEVASSVDNPYKDFMSDFPKYLFYRNTDEEPATNIVSCSNNGGTTWTTPASLETLRSQGVAFTIGNVVAYSSIFTDYCIARETKQYFRVTSWDLSNNPQRYLVVDLTRVTSDYRTLQELEQNLHYDIIQIGVEVSAEQLSGMNLTSKAVFLIVDGDISTVLSQTLADRVNEVSEHRIKNPKGQYYSIKDLYTDPSIVDNFFIKRDRKLVALESQNYFIGDHLIDNTLPLYNNLEERVYTINQLIGNLLVQNLETYTFTTFDLTIPQNIRLFRRKSDSAISEIVNYELNIKTNTSSYTQTESSLGLKYIIIWTRHTYGGDVVSHKNVTQGEFWTECTKLSYANNLPTIYLEQNALIESVLQQYWNEAYAASLLCDIFVPSEWRLKADKVSNYFEIINYGKISVDKAVETYEDEISPAIASTMPSHKITSRGALTVTMTVNDGVINIFKDPYNSNDYNEVMYRTDEFTLQPGYYYMRDPLCPAGVIPGDVTSDPRGARFGVAHLIGTSNYDTDAWDGHSTPVKGWLTSEWREFLVLKPINLMFILKSNKSRALNPLNNSYKPEIIKAEGYSLNSSYVPQIRKTLEKDYIVVWKEEPPQEASLQVTTYDNLSGAWRSEVDTMLECSAVEMKNNLYFSKIADEKYFYTPQTPVVTWTSFLNYAGGVYAQGFKGWNGTAINYMTSRFYDAGLSNYERLLQQRDDTWRDLFKEYPFLFLETSYKNDSATTSQDLLTLAKYAFEDQKRPEKSYTISLIDLVQAIETMDKENSDWRKIYNHNYFREAELHIGDGIMISPEDYTDDRDDVYEALSQYLYISDISRDLRSDANCQLTVNTIKYQDKLIRRLATMIRKNPLH